MNHKPQNLLDSKVFAALAFSVMAGIVVFLQIRGFAFAGSGLDPSWMLGLEYAARENWTWGKDIIFTFGPLGYLSPALFHPDTAVAVLAWQVTLLLGWLVFLSACRPVPTVVLLAVSLPALLIGVDHLALVLPVGGAILSLRGHYRRALLLFLLAGLAANVKFSSFVAGFLLAGVTDLLLIKEILHRRALPASILVGVGLIAGFVFAGQPISALWGFVSASLQMASGYSDAMVQYGPSVDIVVFLMLGLIAGAAGLASAGLKRRIAWVVLWAAVLFLLFKLGYVRHSGIRHSFTLATLAAVAVFFFAANATRVASVVLLAQVAVLAGMGVVATAYLPNSQTPATAWKQTAARFSNRWQTLTGLMSPAYREGLRARREATDKQVASLWQVPEGTSVDAIGWDAALAMNSGGEYRPRPVFQSYAAYSPSLAGRNLQFYQETPPDRIHFRSTGIDWRWPGLGDGSLHPYIQQNYQISKRLPDALELTFVADQACDDSTMESVPGRLGEWLDLAASPGVNYLKLDLTTNWLHSARKAVFKSSLLMLEARLGDGSLVERRFPSGFSGLWFPATPFVDYGNELLLFSPDIAPLKAQVKQIRLREGVGGKSGVASDLRWTQRTLRCDPEEVDWASKLVSNALYDHPHGPKFEQGAISAHAPMLFELPVESLSSVSLEFGIRDGAWQQGQTDGVRFDIVTRDRQGQERMVATRTLKPLTIAADRGDQTLTASFDVPFSGIVMIGILPLDNTGWDWSYIRNLTLHSIP